MGRINTFFLLTTRIWLAINWPLRAESFLIRLALVGSCSKILSVPDLAPVAKEKKLKTN